MKSKVYVFVMLFVALLSPSILGGGCYCFAPVAENEVGLQMNDGVSITKVQPPGRYQANLGYFADFKTIDCQAQIVQWEDPSLVTKDKQPIGFSVAITVKRDCSESSIRNMWRNYNGAARNNDMLAELVRSRAPDAAKAVTTQFTLDDMLGISQGEMSGRAKLVSTFKDSLAEGLEGTSVLVEAINVNDIVPSQAYLGALEEKAKAQVETEVAQERTRQLVEQLKQEEQQTNISLEKARRENLVNEEMSKAVELSDRFYELKRLEALKDVIGDSDKIYFVPEGVDITLFLGGQGVVPVEAK